MIVAIGDALDDAELTVDDLTLAIRERTGPWAVERTMDAFQDKWPRWRQLTSTAAHRGVLCFGPNRGRNVTYTNPRRWLPGFQPLGGIRGRARARPALPPCLSGPPRPNTSRRWLAIPSRGARELVRGARRRARGSSTWTASRPSSRGDTNSRPSRPRGVRLLPYFDAYMVAGQPRARLFPGVAATRALAPAGQAGNYPVLLVDGVVGGVWHHRRSGKHVGSPSNRFAAHSGATTPSRGGRGARRPGARGRAGAGDRPVTGATRRRPRAATPPADAVAFPA